MRDILFRGKRIDNGKWVEGLVSYPHVTDTEKGVESYYFQGKDEMDFWFQCTVSAETVCQFTGLTDKNGNKIWENDIVKQSFYKYLENEIESEEISGCEIGVVGIIPTKGTCMKNPLQYVEVNGEIEKNFEKTKMYKGVCQYRCEVIGNIFDNPELLEGGA